MNKARSHTLGKTYKCVTSGFSEIDNPGFRWCSVEQNPEKVSPFFIAYHLLKPCTQGPAYNSEKSKEIIGVCSSMDEGRLNDG